jgi:pre-rRNA-processing protein TSR1
MSSSDQQSHHHRAGPLRQRNKTHKSATISKREAKRQSGSGGAATTTSTTTQPTTTKSTTRARITSAKTRKQQRNDIMKKNRGQLHETSHSDAPRIVLVIGLSETCNLTCLSNLIRGNSTTTTTTTTATPSSMEIIQSSSSSTNNNNNNNPPTSPIEFFSPEELTTNNNKFNNGLKFLIPSQSRSDVQGTIRRVVDAIKVADMVIFQIPVNGSSSATTTTTVNSNSSNNITHGLDSILENSIDSLGRTLISVIKTIGLPTTLGAIENLDLISDKHRNSAKKNIIEWFHQEISQDVKVHEINNTNRDVWIRSLLETGLKSITWLSERSMMLCESIESNITDSNGNDILTVSGVIRGRPLSINNLIHLSGFGTFAIHHATMSTTSSLTTLPTSSSNVMEVDNYTITTIQPSIVPGPPVMLATPDVMAGEQTWPTKEEIEMNTSNNNNSTSNRKESIDEGREYLKAWGVDELDNNFNNNDDDDDDDDDDADIEMTNRKTNHSISFNNTGDEKRKRAEMDLEYPDEIDTPSDIPARERFIKYRGLKSFRTSPWNPRESLPREYGYIYDLQNFKRIQQQILRQSENINMTWIKSQTLPDQTYIPPGVFVRFTLSVPRNKQQEIISGMNHGIILILTSLLEHENKLSVVNTMLRPIIPTMTENQEKNIVVESRDELELHVGIWRKLCRPTFSEPNLNCDKYKMERFLAPSRWTVASAYGPITFGTSVPALLFTKQGDLVACGSLDSIDPNRIVLKKMVLSGHPFRVKKRWAVIRKMFYNPEDVAWFRPLEIYTKMGARGKILESVGTHGRMKVLFDRNISQGDTVCLDLYKRVFPKCVKGDEETFQGVDLGVE